MQIVETKVTHRKSPPGACVEFTGSDGANIEVELRGEEFVEMCDEDIVARARATMSGAGAVDADAISDEAGVDQTLETP